MMNSSQPKSKQHDYRRIVLWAGRLLLLLSLIFLSALLWRYGSDVLALLTDRGVLLAAAQALVVMFVGVNLLALSWHCLLLSTSRRSIALADTWMCYAKSNVAKYVPGNVFHLALRQVVGAKIGLSQRTLAAASAMEIAGAIGWGVVGYAAFTWVGLAQPTLSLISYLLIALAAGVFVAVAVPALRRKLTLPDRISWRRVAVAMALQALFFSLSGLAAVLVAMRLVPNIGEVWMLVAGATIGSFVVGLLTPGAPAGIGVREGIFVGMTTAVLGPSVALSIALLTRLAWMLADLALLGSVNVVGARGLVPDR